MQKTPTREQMISDIKTCCKQHGMSFTQFGLEATGDGSFYGRLCRKEISPTLKRIEKVYNFMEHPTTLSPSTRDKRETATDISRRTANSRKQFASRLTQSLNDKGWTASELARQLNCSRTSVSKYLQGEAMPRATVLQKIAGVLNWTSESLQTSQTNLPSNAEDVFLCRSVGNGEYWLHINQKVDGTTALEVMKLLNSSKTVA
jgi:transcriptional regulator with XRE-family HTH domain